MIALRVVLRYAHDQLRDLTHDARSARAPSLGEVPLLRNQAPMPPQEGIRRDYGVEFELGFAPYRLSLARQKSPLSVAEPNSLSSQPFFEQAVLGPEKFDGEQLMPMDASPTQSSAETTAAAGTEPMPTFYSDRRSNLWTARG